MTWREWQNTVYITFIQNISQFGSEASWGVHEGFCYESHSWGPGKAHAPFKHFKEYSFVALYYALELGANHCHSVSIFNLYLEVWLFIIITIIFKYEINILIVVMICTKFEVILYGNLLPLAVKRFLVLLPNIIPDQPKVILKYSKTKQKTYYSAPIWIDVSIILWFNLCWFSCPFDYLWLSCFGTLRRYPFSASYIYVVYI